MIDWTTQHLKKHGSDTPRLDAEILLAFARGCPRIQLYVQYNELPTEPQRAVMRDLVRRRALAEPVAYLVGHREFFGLDFQVTRDVLIPRPETETLVLETLSRARPLAAPQLLELGTGSGCIAVSLAKQLPAARLTAVDISPAALAVARQNAERHQVADRIEFLEGDLFAPLPPGSQFDCVVSNPPYIADSEMATLPPDVRLHEPTGALQAGPRGLDVIERIVAQAPAFLRPHGWLLLEMDPAQTEAIQALVDATGAFEEFRAVRDPSGDNRVIFARRRSGD